ncbi:MAG: hypothetical protein IJ587_03115 [Synergistaceae bacterium]|nr:hypothetical protein [Synergistaceae bacterium]
MKKICVLLLVQLLVFGTASYGAVSEDMSVYLRKDVFDAKIEALFSRLHAEIGEVRGDIKALSTRVDGIDKRMDSLDKRIDDLRNGIYLWLVAIGLLIAWPKLIEKFQNWGKSKPSITLEDVKRLIEEQLEKNNAELRKSIQL